VDWSWAKVGADKSTSKINLTKGKLLFFIGEESELNVAKDHLASSVIWPMCLFYVQSWFFP
jgi:hypothetical protein